MAEPTLANTAPNRQEAKRLGLPFFYAPKPCHRKHDPTIRYAAGGQCVRCAGLKHQEWMAVEKNYQRKLDGDHAYYRRPGNKEKNIQGAKARRAANPQRRRDTDNAAYVRNPAPFKARTERWEKKRPTSPRIRQSRRRSKAREAEGNHTLADMLEILAAQSFRCAYYKGCGRTLTVTSRVDDHIIALANGGTNWRRNMQCLCRPCNASKQDKDPIDWVRKKFGWLI